MSESFMIYTTADVGKSQFAAFLKNAGGVLDPDNPEHGRVSADRRHVWIFLGDLGLEPLPEDVAALVTDRLGGAPRSELILEPSSKPGTEALALDVAIAFAELWPAVLSNADDVALTLEELRRVRRDGASLHALFYGAAYRELLLR
jgi:hypothetical protein